LSRDAPEIRTIATAATRLIGICGKCGKKLGGGFGADGDKTLAKLLKRTVVGARGKRASVRVMTTACLDLCPKGAVAMVDSQTPGTILVVRKATDVTSLCTRLGLPQA